MTRDEVHARVRLQDDVLPARPVVGALAGALAFAAGLALVAWLLVWQRAGELRPSRRFPEARLAPPGELAGVEVELFAGPGQGQRLAARRRRLLDTWGWVDRRAGIVRMPVDQAIELVLEEERR